MVREYQTQFEKLASHTKGLDEEFFHSYFIGGLKEENQVQVKIFNSSNMVVAIGLAKLEEDKFNEQHKQNKQTTWKSQTSQSD